MKIVFLDIDGVLNGYGYLTKPIYHLYKLFGKRYEVFGVHKLKVKRLAKIIKKTDAKIVISSTWRGAIKSYLKDLYIGDNKSDEGLCYFFNHCVCESDLKENEDCTYNDVIKLLRLFKKYDFRLAGFTESGCSIKREIQINNWLNSHKNFEVESFCVLDDDSFDLQSFVGNKLVQTSSIVKGEMIRGLCYERTGLKRKHVKQAIKILNKKGEN